MAETDIRWIQRLENFSKALEKLNEAAQIMEKELHYSVEVNDLLKEGLIQRFEYTHELAWNVMKDYAEYQGSTDIRGSRDAIRWALHNGLANDKAWMKSIEDRNLSSHDYDSMTADSIFIKVIETYLPLFNQFEQTMKEISRND
ncbi:MAG: nucleotidyltransferase substrate binding protein [Prevotella sp.]|nr:nucleotidyltransferase substrate binding protein [Prevotella sp.]